MRDVDLDGVNTVCPHDKYFEDCDDCIDDKKWCHYECDDVSGCGVLIHSEDCQGGDDYCSDFFIGTKSFKFCPMCGKEINFYWQKSSYIAMQFQREREKEERRRLKAEEDRLKKEEDRLKKEEIERLDGEILELKNLRKEIKVSDFKQKKRGGRYERC